MKKHIKEHFAYHVSQVSILCLGFLGFVALSGQTRLWFLLVSIFSYAGVGILHHALNHNLFPKIVLEYLLVGALAASIIIFMLRGGLGL